MVLGSWGFHFVDQPLLFGAALAAVADAWPPVEQEVATRFPASRSRNDENLPSGDF